MSRDYGMRVRMVFSHQHRFINMARIAAVVILPSCGFNRLVVTKVDARKNAATTSPVDSVAPVPGNSGVIDISGLSTSGFTLTWTKATDSITAQTKLAYEVLISTSNNISSVSDAQSNGIIVKAFTNDIKTAGVSGLNSDSHYWYTVLVKDAAGNLAVYTTSDIYTLHVCGSTAASAVSGTTVITETYNNGVGAAQYDAATSGCWQTYKSDFSFMQAGDIQSTFTTYNFGAGVRNARQLNILYRSGVQTNATVDYAPYSTPATGWDSGQFPYVADVLRDKKCYGDVMVISKSATVGTGGSSINGLLLNVTIHGTGASREITGYLIHANGGGNSVTLARFIKGNDHALDFIDHFPGSYGDSNPKSDGPYKGWNYFQGAFPAGGDTNVGNSRTIAARYSYNSTTGAVTIQWEVRPISGVDGTPGAWDQSVTLTGTDAIAPGGGFGFYDSYYGAIDTNPGGVAAADFSMTCVNP